MAIGIRHFEFVRATSGRNTEMVPRWYPVLSTRSNGTALLPGRFAVQVLTADPSSCDGAVAADTVTTAARLVMGLVHAVTDNKGNLRLASNLIGAAEAGGVLLVPARGNIFRGLQDDTTALTVGNVYGHTPGTITNTGTNDTFTPAQYSNDVLKRSGGSATLTTNAFGIIGKDPDSNNNGVKQDGTAAALVYEFYVTDTFGMALL